MKHILCLLLLLTTVLEANIEKYLKKCPNKADIHSLKNIDFIYIINLDQRPEKWKSCIDQLMPFGIYPYRFSAVNGWELPLEAINDVGVKYESWMESGKWGTCYLIEDKGEPKHELVYELGKNYFCHCMSRGAVGIALSHLSVLQDAYDAGYETIWVMEDDVLVIRDPRLLSDLVEKLDALVGNHGWDILFTDRDTINQEGQYIPCTAYAWRPNFSPQNPYIFGFVQEISEDFRRVGARYGAYSMIVRRSGMKKILNFFKNYHIFLPYDMEYTLPKDIRLFTVIRDVVSTQPRAASDNGAPNYKNRLIVSNAE
jgi:GR25 family glycosyltransferase involved in LPS biosynthesis